MVKMPRQILGTPFKVRNRVILKRTNMKVEKLVGQVELNKQNILTRNLRDRIESRALPRRRRPGAIE